MPSQDLSSVLMVVDANRFIVIEEYRIYKGVDISFL